MHMWISQVFTNTYDTFICALHLYDKFTFVTNSHVWHDSFVTRQQQRSFHYQLRRYLWHVWHDTFIHVTWLIHVRDIHEAFMDESRHTYVIYVCPMTPQQWMTVWIHVVWLIYVWRDSLICVTWRIHIYDMIHSSVRHKSVNSRLTFKCVNCRCVLHVSIVDWLLNV